LVTLYDQDGDGIVAWNDCDDTDPAVVLDSRFDVDCDGVPTASDCDDSDPNNTIDSSTDADCDGFPTDVDCEDNNPNSSSSNCALSSASTTFGPVFLNASTGWTVEYWALDDPTVGGGNSWLFRTWGQCNTNSAFMSGAYLRANTAHFHGSNSNSVVSGATTPGAWNHIAATFHDSGGMSLFVNGVWVGTGGGVNSGTCSALIAAGPATWYDEMRLSNTRLYMPPASFTPPVSMGANSNTIALFDFDQPGLVATDLTGNGYDITWDSLPTRGSGRP